jgi:membrane-associated phospholipid phosphatase
MVSLSRFGDAAVVVPLTGGVLLYLALQRHWRTINYWLAAAGFGMLSSVLLKYSLRIPRPDSGIQGLSPYAFPSTHAMRATVLYGFLAVMIARALPARWRWLPYSVAGILMAMVSISRVYLGVHWLSDVLASLALGLAWIAALGVAYHRHTAVETHWRGLAAGAVGLLVVAFGWQTWRAQTSDLAQYTPRRPFVAMRETQWWDQGWAELPAVRQDTRGLDTDPLDLQYAGPLPGLSRRLRPQGWRRVPALGWRDLLALLSPSLPLARLPVLPQVHQGRHERLALVKDLSPERRVVIRLWRSDRTLEPGLTPLWVGNASFQQRAELFSLVGYAVTGPDFHGAFEQLRAALSEGGLILRQPSTSRDLLLARISHQASTLASDPHRAEGDAPAKTRAAAKAAPLWERRPAAIRPSPRSPQELEAGHSPAPTRFHRNPASEVVKNSPAVARATPGVSGKAQEAQDRGA